MNLKKLLFVSLSFFLLASCNKSDDPYMTLATKSLNVEAEGGSFTFDLASNVYYRVNNDCYSDDGDTYWAVIETNETQGEITKFTIKVEDNATIEPRTGVIRFIGDNVTPLKFLINQKGIVPKGISPTSDSVSASDTEAIFKVFTDKEWSIECEDDDVIITPTEGLGESDIKLTFPQNMTLTKRTIVVNVLMFDNTKYSYTLEQAAFSGVLADWDLNNLIESTSLSFTDDADQISFPGANGKIIYPSIGSGKIEYVACDRTEYIQDKVRCTRAVGSNGDPYVSGTIPGDYWYIYANIKGSKIPAGKKIHFYFVTKFGTMCSNYWMIEFKDGENWVPALPTSTKQESATTTISGASIDYSATITYNYAGMLLDTKNNGAYLPVEGTFTTTKDMDEIVLRFGEVGRLCLEGAKYSGKYIDCTHTSGQSRFSAQRPNNSETGEAIKVFDQHVLLEIVE